MYAVDLEFIIDSLLGLYTIWFTYGLHTYKTLSYLHLSGGDFSTVYNCG